MFKPFKITLVEVFLLQTAVWLTLWLSNEWLAKFLTVSVGAMLFSVLVISAIAEKIERSRVPVSYFRVMIVSLISVFVAWGIYAFISASSF
jgi:hypothetical protein